MKYSFVFVAAAGAAFAATTPCAAACNDALDKCSTAPGANHSYCDANYSGCLGEVPTTWPATSCSADKEAQAGGSKAAATGTTPDACAAKCNAELEKCSNAPGANHSLCDANYNGCLGEVPPAYPATTCAPSKGGKAAAAAAAPAAAAPSDACAAKCWDELNKCSSADGANHSLCDANYNGCLGEVPASYPAPTCAPSKASGAAAAAAAPTASPDACAAKCTEEYDKCSAPSESKPSPNHSFCFSQFSGCLGFVPTSKPTACASKSMSVIPRSATTAAAPAGTSAAQAGTTTTAAAAAGTTTAAGPVGTAAPSGGVVPGNGTVIAGAGMVKPAVAMLALGAVALL